MFSILYSKQSKIAVGMVFAFLCMVLLPLFIIAHFNYPCTDDFAYAGTIYTGVKNGSSFWNIVSSCWETALRFYHRWQGRYFDDVVSSFGVGIAIPKYYFMGTYLTLILFVSGCVSFVRTMTFKLCCWSSAASWILSILMTASQLLYIPYPSEGFFWYVGATGYTIAYALLLLLGAALICFYQAEEHYRRIFYGIASALLAFMIGGSNYATGLLTAEILVLILFGMLLRKKKCYFLGIVTVEYLVCFIKYNALAPGNASRMGAVESMGVAGSIIASLRQGSVFLKEWFHIPVLLFLAVIFILGAHQAAKMNFSFRLPGLVSVMTFGLFCSMMTPPFFAGATWGPGRLINLVYFSYYFLLAGNLLYWTGWAAHKYEKFRLVVMKEIKVLPVLICYFVLILACLKIYGLQSTSSSSALLSLVKGEAAEYLKENELRWEIYTDDSIKDAVVEDFSVKPYVLYHDDIVEDEADWRNSAVAGFFGKDSVKLKK